MKAKIVHILLVDDDEVDVEAVKRSFRKEKIANPLTVASDGLEALKILRGVGGEPLPRPYLVLLDLNMPRMNGIEFLDVLRGDPKLKDSIVFVLTTSDEPRDVMASYEKNVAGYIIKSRAGEQFSKLIKLLDHYWRYVEFPPEGAHVG